MKPVKIFLCEDEELQLKINGVIVKDYLDKKRITAEYVFCNHYKDGDDVLLRSIELAILDIDLGEYNGIELAKKMRSLNPNVVIIFITAHKGYSLEASQIHLSGFLTKPIDPWELTDTMELAIAQVFGSRATNRNVHIARFQNDRVQIRERHIISIEKIYHTREVEITTTKNKIRDNKTISQLKEELSDCFVKLSRSVLVNLAHIYTLEERNVVMSNGVCYQISTRQMRIVQKLYDDYVAKS